MNKSSKWLCYIFKTVLRSLYKPRIFHKCVHRNIVSKQVATGISISLIPITHQLQLCVLLNWLIRDKTLQRSTIQTYLSVRKSKLLPFCLHLCPSLNCGQCNRVLTQIFSDVRLGNRKQQTSMPQTTVSRAHLFKKALHFLLPPSFIT